MRIRTTAIRPLLRTAVSWAARCWHAFANLPAVQVIKSALSRLANAGTAGYPPDARRRLKILNMIAYLVAISTFIYAVQQATTDYETYAPMVWLNGALVITALLVPLAHRISDVAGGLLLIGAEYVALLGFTDFFTRESGAQIQYIILAAAPFVIFDLKRIRLILSIVGMALALHLVAWFSFPNDGVLTGTEKAIADSQYILGAVTTFGLIAASIYYAFSLAARAKAEVDSLLRNILPDSIVQRLKEKPGAAVADSFPEASIMFADISGFVALARKLGVTHTVELLNNIVSRFDDLAAVHQVEKIKTIGDAYMVAAGVPVPVEDHALRLARMGFDMLETIAQLRDETGEQLSIRIGLASGPVMAGVIGTRKFSYDVWGDAVNLASRLESLSLPGRILVCPRCHERLGTHFAFEYRGTIEIKGVGQQETWFLVAGERQDAVA